MPIPMAKTPKGSWTMVWATLRAVGLPSARPDARFELMMKFT